jgi:hypothetical protein
MEVIYEVHRWDGLTWHNIHIEFHENWFGHSGSIKVITLIIWEAVVLVILMRMIQPLRWPQMAWHIPTKFHDDRFRNWSNIKGITSTVWEAIVLISLMIRIYGVRHWEGLRWHDIYIQISMNIGTGVQAILRSCLSNLNGCNVGITDGSESQVRRWDRLRWHDKPTTFHEDWYGRSSNN